MAIQLEFINLIIPIQVIERKYTGGWDGYLSDHSNSLGKVSWFDDHLIRASGAMTPDMIDVWIKKFTKLGFQPTEVIIDKIDWKDLCICDAFGFTKHDCPWMVIDGAARIGWFQGTVTGEVIGRDHYRR